MIKHIVLFSAKNPNDVSIIKSALERMSSIPQVNLFQVTYNSKRDKFSKEIDVVLYSEFESWADLAAYQDHPIYHETTEMVRPLRNQRIVVDFEG